MRTTGLVSVPILQSLMPCEPTKVPASEANTPTLRPALAFLALLGRIQELVPFRVRHAPKDRTTLRPAKAIAPLLLLDTPLLVEKSCPPSAQLGHTTLDITSACASCVIRDHMLPQQVPFIAPRARRVTSRLLVRRAAPYFVLLGNMQTNTLASSAPQGRSTHPLERRSVLHAQPGLTAVMGRPVAMLAHITSHTLILGRIQMLVAMFKACFCFFPLLFVK